LPDGKSVLFTIFNMSIPTGTGGPGAAKVAVQSLKTSVRRDVLGSGTFAHYAPSGHIVYAQGTNLTQGTNLMAAPFDLRRLTVTGNSVSVIEGVLPTQYSFSSAGTLVYVPAWVQGAQLKFVWVDRNGKEEPVPAPARNYVMPRISPDGKRVAAGIEEAESQIWLYDLTRDAPTRLTFEGTTNVDPVWTPNGERIAYKAGNRLFWQAADGSGAAEALTNEPLSSNDVPGSWSPDGQVLGV